MIIHNYGKFGKSFFAEGESWGVLAAETAPERPLAASGPGAESKRPPSTTGIYGNQGEGGRFSNGYLANDSTYGLFGYST